MNISFPGSLAQIICILLFALAAFAQPKGSSSGSPTTTPEAGTLAAQKLKVLEQSGILFKEGLIALKENKGVYVGEKFKASVEVFPNSKIDIQSDQDLKNCYYVLEETIHRIEFPSESHFPSISTLANICGWSIDDKFADEIVESLKASRPRPTPVETSWSKSKPLSTVRANAGDTIESVAKRNGFGAEAIATLNGLHTFSALTEGREVFIPDLSSELWSKDIKKTLGGPKPVQAKDGKIRAVVNYLNETLNDPFSVRFLSWSPVTMWKTVYGDYWLVKVKYRAKNLFGAYILTEQTFYIQSNKVVMASK